MAAGTAIDDLVASAAAAMGCSIATVSLVDQEGTWVQLCNGSGSEQMPRDSAFCAQSILGDGLLEVRDAATDPRFADNPIVTGEPCVRFFAGVPLRSHGQNVGTLCVFGREPRRLDPAQQALLTHLARTIEAWIATRRELDQVRREKLAIERTSRAKSKLLTQVSHELRNPLHAILGFAQVMQADTLLDARSQSRLRHLQSAGQHMLELLGDLLDLAFVEHGAGRLPLAPVTVAHVLESSLVLIEPLATKRGIRIVSARSGDAVMVHANARALTQVLLNLLSNAVKYNRQHGTLWVDVRVVGCEVATCIGDEGKGLTMAQRLQLFQPFERLDAQDGRIPGSGLGLVISRQLIEAMRGRLEVQQRPEGGCQFEVWLPAKVASNGPACEEAVQAELGATHAA